MPTREKRARALGVPIDQLPDGRGKHGHHVRGPKYPRWTEERMTNDAGYVMVRVGSGHPLADPNGYAYEHALVWVAAGRPLPSLGALLHHRNEVKTDNRLDNLELLSRAEHNRRHSREHDPGGRFVGKEAVPARCHDCAGTGTKPARVGKRAAGRLLDDREWNETEREQIIRRISPPGEPRPDDVERIGRELKKEHEEVWSAVTPSYRTHFVAWEDDRDYWMAQARAAIAAIPSRAADDPEMDATDFAHPAWWRGNDAGVHVTVQKLTDALDGKDDGKGVTAYPPFEALYRRLIAGAMTERALKVAMRALQGIDPGGYGVNSPYAQAKRALAKIADIMKEPQG